MLPYVNIHTHRPTGSGIELRTAGVHPWDGRDAGRRNARPASRRGAGRGRNGTGFRARRRPCGPAVRTADAVAAGPRAGTTRGAPLRQGLRAADARTGGLGTPGRDFPRGFIGSPEQARQALAKGYCLSFGERTFASPKTLAALRGTPLSQLFLETDDSPVPIAEIYARAAEAKGVPEEVLQRAILDNYKRIFTGGEYEGPGRTKGDK